MLLLIMIIMLNSETGMGVKSRSHRVMVTVSSSVVGEDEYSQTVSTQTSVFVQVLCGTTTSSFSFFSSSSSMRNKKLFYLFIHQTEGNKYEQQ